MKNVLLITFIFLCGTLSIAAQEKQLYKSLDAMQQDTTAFLQYNFIERAGQYSGVTVDTLLADLQIEPILSGMIFSLYEDAGRALSGIRLYLFNRNGCSTYVQLYFEDPIPYTKQMRHLFDKYGINSWVPRYKTIFGPLFIHDVTTNAGEK